jgi:hypothetical protein
MTSGCVHITSGLNADGTQFCGNCGAIVFTYECRQCGPVTLQGDSYADQVSSARDHMSSHSITKHHLIVNADAN